MTTLGYIDAKLKASDLGRDCLKLAEEFLDEANLGGRATLAKWRAEAVQKVEEATSAAQREAAPDPYAPKIIGPRWRPRRLSGRKRLRA
jgi:TPP-dependent pyruvate/acetoin dehydrogenase alpha subunit